VVRLLTSPHWCRRGSDDCRASRDTVEGSFANGCRPDPAKATPAAVRATGREGAGARGESEPAAVRFRRNYPDITHAEGEEIVRFTWRWASKRAAHGWRSRAVPAA
jgi:hypothetical protein